MTYKFLILAAMLVGVPTVGASKQAAAADEYCREYTKTISVGGRAERAYGTACHRPDGSWEIVDLQGSSERARAGVRDKMYDDIERVSNASRYDRDRVRVVVVERYDRTPRYYRSHNRHHAVSYNSLPFGFYIGNYYGYNKDHARYERKFNKKVYNKNYRNVSYDRKDKKRR